MKQVEVFTDGACRGNPGPGGWGVILRHEQRERELYGGEPATTNNRMELTAAIRALEALTERCRIEIYTDSTYVKDGITKWLDGWRARGWSARPGVGASVSSAHEEARWRDRPRPSWRSPGQRSSARPPASRLRCQEAGLRDPTI